MRVISWACRAGGMVVSVHYEARVTPFLKGGMEWGSAPMLPSQAGVGKPPVDRKTGSKAEVVASAAGVDLDRTKSGVVSHTTDGGEADGSRLRVFSGRGPAPAPWRSDCRTPRIVCATWTTSTTSSTSQTKKARVSSTRPQNLPRNR